MSSGCKNCFAQRQAARFRGPGMPYEGLVDVRGRWTGRARFVPEKLSEPLRWRKPRRVFVNSMSDLFHEHITDEQIAAVFGVMAACPHITFQILTKRPQRMLEWFGELPMDSSYYFAGCADDAINNHQGMSCGMAAKLYNRCLYSERSASHFPLPNVWMGVSVEDQATATARIPLLLQCPAAVRWVSAEPLLGPIGLRPSWTLGYDFSGGYKISTPRISWIVIGGESGPGARPCDVAWIRSIVEQCRSLGVSAFVKQVGSTPMVDGYDLHRWPRNPGWMGAGTEPGNLCLADRKGGDPEEWPQDLRVRQFPEVPHG